VNWRPHFQSGFPKSAQIAISHPKWRQDGVEKTCIMVNCPQARKGDQISKTFYQTLPPKTPYGRI
jgi:hypothetical protein